MTVVTRFNFPEGLLPKEGKVTQPQSGTPAETALATLREHCTPAQQATLDAGRSFEAVGPSGKRYALALTEKNVEVRWRSELHGAWLAVVKGRAATLPVGDLALLAKLAIENAEQWWQVAGNACGSVWVEDRASALYGHEWGYQQAVAQHALAQNVIVQAAAAAQQQAALLQQNPLLPVGTLYTDVFGHRYQWTGQGWQPL